MLESETASQGPRPRTRREVQAETRARVLVAAAESFTEVGYQRSSVAEIAARAGYSPGALYSNFSSKDDLFLAVLDQRFDQHVEMLIAAYGATDSLEEGFAAIADLYGQRLDEQFEWNLALVEFTLRARNDEELRSQLAERHRSARESFAAALSRIAEHHGHELPAPAEVVASAIVGVTSGLLIEHLLDPGARTVDAYRHALFSAVGITGG